MLYDHRSTIHIKHGGKKQSKYELTALFIL